MRHPSTTIRTLLVVVGVTVLAACAPASNEPEASEAAASSDPPSTTSEPSASTAPDDLWTFETRDGSMRMALPDGWTVDDRSVVSPGSEMYNAGPTWLGDVVVLDADGDQMLWYRETYGTDQALPCGQPPAAALEQSADPMTAGLRADLEAQAAATGVAVPDFQIRGEVAVFGAPSRWVATLGLVAGLPDGAQCGWSGEIWAGSRLVEVDAVGDDPSSDGSPASPIAFGSEEAATAWLGGHEAATIAAVLASIELTGAPLLDYAP